MVFVPSSQNTWTIIFLASWFAQGQAPDTGQVTADFSPPTPTPMLMAGQCLRTVCSQRNVFILENSEEVGEGQKHQQHLENKQETRMPVWEQKAPERPRPFSIRIRRA